MDGIPRRDHSEVLFVPKYFLKFNLVILLIMNFTGFKGEWLKWKIWPFSTCLEKRNRMLCQIRCSEIKYLLRTGFQTWKCHLDMSTFWSLRQIKNKYFRKKKRFHLLWVFLKRCWRPTKQRTQHLNLSFAPWRARQRFGALMSLPAFAWMISRVATRSLDTRALRQLKYPADGERRGTWERGNLRVKCDQALYSLSLSSPSLPSTLFPSLPCWLNCQSTEKKLENA